MGGFLPPAERHSSALLAVFTAVSLLLLVAGERLPAAGLRGVGAWVFAPFDRVVLVLDRVAAAWRENQRLHERIATLEIENARLHIAAVENARLRDSLGLPAWSPGRLKAVEILALAGSPVPTAATLSAGARQGVHEGDVVVTHNGLLGRVTEVYPSLSRAVLVTDPGSAVACEVESTAVLGMLRRSSVPHPRMVLTGIPMGDTLHLGQRVLTSGLSRRYPRGIPVGSVARLGRDPSGLTQDVEIELASRLTRLRHGFILVGPAPLELTP
jgi:rod shape-determining protein MreC